MIQIYSKVGCVPCEFLKDRVKKYLNTSQYEIIEFDTDEEVFKSLSELGRKSVPTLVTEEGGVLGYMEAMKYVKNI